MLLVKLKNLRTSACLKLNYGTIKQTQKCKGCKDGGIHENFSNFVNSVILTTF